MAQYLSRTVDGQLAGFFCTFICFILNFQKKIKFIVKSSLSVNLFSAETDFRRQNLTSTQQTRDIYSYVGTMLDQCRRRWANIVLTVGKCLVFAGNDVRFWYSNEAESRTILNG